MGVGGILAGEQMAAGESPVEVALASLFAGFTMLALYTAGLKAYLER